MEDNNKKLVIYQLFRWFGNNKPFAGQGRKPSVERIGQIQRLHRRSAGRHQENSELHISWLTGIIEHATKTNYSVYGIKRDHSAVVKGNAGSPYAIKDYYDVDPDLSVNVYNRMNEFRKLPGGTDSQSRHEGDHRFCRQSWLRQYGSDSKLPYIEDLGQNDNTSNAFDPDNNFYYLPGQTLTRRFGAQQEDFEYSEFPAKSNRQRPIHGYTRQERLV